MTRFPTDPQLQIRTEKAQLDPYFRFAELTLDVKRNGYQIEFTPAKLEIDNSGYFDSVNLKSMEAFSADYVMAAQNTAREAAGKASEAGEAVAQGASIGALAYLQTTKSIDRMLVCVQPQRPVINCIKSSLDVSYTKDEYDFSWDTGGAGATYYPYSLEMWVEFLDRS